MKNIKISRISFISHSFDSLQSSSIAKIFNSLNSLRYHLSNILFFANKAKQSVPNFSMASIYTKDIQTLLRPSHMILYCYSHCHRPCHLHFYRHFLAVPIHFKPYPEIVSHFHLLPDIFSHFLLFPTAFSLYPAIYSPIQPFSSISIHYRPCPGTYSHIQQFTAISSQ